MSFSQVRFGFEVEMFLSCSETPNGVRIPSNALPVDGFPGLVEFRSRGGLSLEEAWAQPAQLAVEHDFSTVDLRKTEAPEKPGDLSGLLWTYMIGGGTGAVILAVVTGVAIMQPYTWAALFRPDAAIAMRVMQAVL